jgi:hypothetical protein
MFRLYEIALEGKIILYPSVAPHNHSLTNRSIYNNIILPLARAWEEDDILDIFDKHLVILTPEVS